MKQKLTKRNCTKQGYSSRNRAEVIAVSIFEYDEEKHMKSEWEEGLKTGLDNLSLLLKSLMETGKTEELQRVLSDKEYREQLYREYFPKNE